MYFWRIDRLKDDLIHDRVSQRDSFLYLLVGVGLMVVALEFSPYFPIPPRNKWDYLSSFLAVVITLAGYTWIYVWNGGKSGDRFVERCISIGWVLLIRFTALLFPIALITAFLTPTDDSQTLWWEVMVLQIWYFAYFWRTAVHVRAVAEKRGV